MNVNHLHDVALLQIFTFLDLRSRTACELVCQRWRILMPSVQPLDFKLHFRKTEDIFGVRPSAVFPHRTSVSYYKENVFIPSISSGIAFLKRNNRGRRLAIKAEDTKQLTVCLDVVVSHCKNIIALDIEVSKDVKNDFHGFLLRNYADLIADHKSSLVVTTIRLPEVILAEEDLLKLLGNCPNLESLVANVAGQVDGKCLAKLPHKLTTLVLRGLCFLGGHLDTFLSGDAKQLQQFSLTLRQARDLSKVCERMVNLTSLSLCVRDDLSVHVHALTELKQLQNLALFGVRRNTEKPLLSLLCKLLQLKALMVSGSRFTKDFFLQLPTSAAQLECLCLTAFPHYDVNDKERFLVPAECWEALSSMVHLKSVRIFGCTTKYDVSELIRKSRSIQEVSIQDVERDTNAAVVVAMAEKAKENPSCNFWLGVNKNFTLKSRVVPPFLWKPRCLRRLVVEDEEEGAAIALLMKRLLKANGNRLSKYFLDLRNVYTLQSSVVPPNLLIRVRD